MDNEHFPVGTVIADYKRQIAELENALKYANEKLIQAQQTITRLKSRITLLEIDWNTEHEIALTAQKKLREIEHDR